MDMEHALSRVWTFVGVAVPQFLKSHLRSPPAVQAVIPKCAHAGDSTGVDATEETRMLFGGALNVYIVAVRPDSEHS